MFPLELLTMLGSGLLSGMMTIWGMKLKAEAARNDFMLKSLKARASIVKEAREHEGPKGYMFTRRTIALAAIGSIIVLPKLAALFMPETVVTVGYTEFNPGFWFFTSDSEVTTWRQATGFVLTPLDTHLVSAVTGLYFGASMVRNA